MSDRDAAARSGSSDRRRLQPISRRRRRPRIGDLLWQALILAAVAALLVWLVGNTRRNLAARHIASGFGYLGQVAGMPVGESPLPYDPSVNTYGYVLLIGVVNTLRVAIAGVALATILGTLVGIAQLARNWLLARLAGLYIEVIRDIPLLLQLLFWYALLERLPAPREALHPLPGVFLSDRGLALPVPAATTAVGWILAAFAIGVAVTIAAMVIAGRRQQATGRRLPVWPVALLALLGAPVAVWLGCGAPHRLAMPVLGRFNFSGGITVTPEYGALLFGLVIYTASYIAEIVRAGVLAVPRGQWEAASALGLRRGTTLRLVVLPQALRVIVPPLTSQYLNLTKNSSLAVAIGYQDIVSIADTEMNQTGQAIEALAIIMAVYLSISLSISLFMNWFDARMARGRR